MNTAPVLVDHEKHCSIPSPCPHPPQIWSEGGRRGKCQWPSSRPNSVGQQTIDFPLSLSLFVQWIFIMQYTRQLSDQIYLLADLIQLIVTLAIPQQCHNIWLAEAYVCGSYNDKTDEAIPTVFVSLTPSSVLSMPLLPSFLSTDGWTDEGWERERPDGLMSKGANRSPKYESDGRNSYHNL